MKILHIAPTPFFSDRGCHIRILSILNALTHQGAQNILCTYHHGQDRVGIVIHRSSPVPRYTQTTAGPQKGKLKADLRLLALSLKIVWQKRPDIIHTHLHEGLLIGWLVRLLIFWRRIPVISDVQGGLVGELEDYGYFTAARAKGRLLKWAFGVLEYLLLRLPQHVFCSSPNAETICRDVYHIAATRLTLLDDRVDMTPYTSDQSKRDLPFPADACVVIYTGSLLPIKGIDQLKKTMLELLKRRDDVYFLLVGYPTEDLNRFRQIHRLEDHLQVEGRVSYDDLPNYLLAADIGIEPKFSNSGEGSGKLLHYLAAGLAVAAFPTVQSRRLLSSKCIAAGNDPRQLADTVEYLVINKAARRRLGDQNRRTATGYSLEEAGALIYQVYGQIVGDKAVRNQ